MTKSRTAAFALSLMAIACLGTGFAADPADEPKTVAGIAAELAALKAQLAAQQKQIEQLQTALQAQMIMLNEMAANTAAAAAPPRAAGLGEIASSITPMLPPVPTARAASRVTTPPAPQAAAAEASSPLQIKIGDTTIMPVGFMDATAYWRDKDAGGSIGSNFGSVPFNNAATAKLSEMRFSPQNSRIGFRVDGDWKGTHFLAFNEFDFLGASGTNNLSVSNGGFVPRLRLFWVDLRKGEWEILAGQSWSMLTPKRSPRCRVTSSTARSWT
jgi:hypothetical protein